MAIAKRSIFVLLILTINRQGFVSDALPNPRMMWISMQVALETQDRTLFQDKDLEKISDFPNASTSERPTDSTTTDSTSELPTDSTTTDSTSELPTDSTTADSTTSSTTTTTEAVARIYKLYTLYSTIHDYMAWGKNFSSMSVSSFEECKEIAAEGEFGSFTYEEGQCAVSTYWRSDDFITKFLDDYLADPLDVYFLVRDDGTDCYTPNMTLISQGETVILASNVFEEHKRFPQMNACHRLKIECKDNGTLFHSKVAEVESFGYFEPLGRCAAVIPVQSIDIKDARRECSKIFSSLYIAGSEEEASGLITWRRSVAWIDKLPVDFLYDDSSSMFKWNGTDLTISQDDWAPSYPVDPEENRCGFITEEGMINAKCENNENVLCVGIDI